MQKEKVAEVLEKIRPLLQRDGGDVQLVDVQDDGIVKVKLVDTIKKEIPEVKAVESVD
jgi:Fe-S cluster biogenesis protein NfuA